MPAANRYQRTITEYGADPNDQRTIGLMSGLWQRAQSKWAGRYGVANGDPGGSFTGTLTRDQAFMHGTVPMGANPNSFRNGDAAQIDSGLIEGPMGNPTMRIFADRLKRRGAM